MVKQNNVHLIIENNSGVTMMSPTAWFEWGRIADSFEWPSTVPHGQKLDVLCYERDWSVGGCSGMVTYVMNGTRVTFAFSNPFIGMNKLGVGTEGREVWDYMDCHDYSPFNVSFSIGDVNVTCNCRCSGGIANLAFVNIMRD